MNWTKNIFLRSCFCDKLPVRISTRAKYRQSDFNLILLFFFLFFVFLTNARNESPNYCTSIKKYYKIVNSLEILDYCLVGLACCVTVPRLYILGRLPVTRGLQYFTQMAIHAKQGCRIRLEGNGRKKATDRQWTFFF